MIVSLLSLGFVALACRPPATPAPTPAIPPPIPSPVAGPTPVPGPTPPPVVKPKGELRVGLSYLGVEVLDPILVSSSSKFSLDMMYDPLVGLTPEGKTTTQTGVAHKYEASPDKKTWSFYLRKGIKFHNGDELTAEDVKFSIERVMSARSVAAYAGTFREFVDKVETPDPYTVVLRLKEPHVFWDIQMSKLIGTEGLIMPKKYIQEKGEEYFPIHPVGSGLFRFVEHVVGTYIVYEAVEAHWSGVVPKFKRLVMFLVPEDSTRVAMLKTGQADIIEISRERFQELGARFKIFRKGDALTIGAWFDRTWDPESAVSDRRVREALNLAINRKEVIENIFYGLGTPSYQVFWNSWTWGFESPQPYPFDPERAKRLIAEAYPRGVTLNIYSYPRSGFSENLLVASALASYWDRIGVKSKIIPVEYGSYRALKRKGGLVDTLSTHGSESKQDRLGSWRVLNHSTGMLTWTKDPQLDALIEAAERAKNFEDLAARQRAVAEHIRANHYSIGIMDGDLIYAANPAKVLAWELPPVSYTFNVEGVK